MKTRNAERGTRNARSRAAGNGGSVLMEYVVLCCFIALFLVEFMHKQFYDYEKGYVKRGLDWARYVGLLHRAIACPIP